MMTAKQHPKYLHGTAIGLSIHDLTSALLVVTFSLVLPFPLSMTNVANTNVNTSLVRRQLFNHPSLLVMPIQSSH